MKPKQTFAATLLLALVLSVQAFAAFPVDWAFRRPLTDGAATAVTNHQVLIVLTSANLDFTNAQANGNDIRVWDATAAALVPHWVESWDANAQTARIWFKTTNITNTHWLYYGNALATDASDGDSVFLFFDDFGTRRINEGTWEALTNLPIAIQQGVATVLGDYLYAGSGSTAMGTATYTAKFYRYDLTQGLGGTWEELADIPAPNEAATGVESAALRPVGSKLYFLGGQANPTQYTNVYEYDPALDTWATKADMPRKREDFGSAVIGGKIYVFGGREPDFIADVDIYDPALDSWDTTTATNWPVPRQLGDFACAYDGKIYLVSGTSTMVGYPNLVPNVRVDSYTPGTDTWAQLENIPFGVCYKQVNEVNAKLYVLGGAVDHAIQGTPYLQVYDVASNTWVYCTSHFHGFNQTAVHSGKIYTVCGSAGTSSTPPSAKVWRFTPNASFSPTAAGTLDTGKWTATIKGTGGANTLVNNSATRLKPTTSTTSSVNLVSVPTFTNGIAIEMSRASTGAYPHLSLGSGALQDTAGGSTNWWLTVLNSGYTVLGNSLQATSATLFFKENPASGASTDLATALAAAVDDGSRARWSLSYSAAGLLVVKRNDTQLFSVSDSTFLAAAKNIAMTQGSHTSTPGSMQVVDWLFVRTLAATEPSITLGAEEEVSSGAARRRRLLMHVSPHGIAPTVFAKRPDQILNHRFMQIGALAQ